MKKLWDKLAKKNSKYFINSDYGQDISDYQFRDSGLLDTREFIEYDDLIPKNSMILEIGCGTGRMSQFIAPLFDDFVGIDISGEMIKQALNRLPKLKFVETDGSIIPFLDREFDVIFSYIVFQHMRTKEMVESNFKEVFRVLKPGGIFKVRIRTDEVRQDKWWSGVAYTEQSIGLLIKKMGYEILKTEAVEDYGLWLWLKKPIDMK